MKVTITKQKNHLTNGDVCRPQLVDVETMDIVSLSEELALEGSSHSESDIIGVLTLLKNRLPVIIAKGYKVDLGFGVLRPTVSGSMTESAFRASLKKGYLAQGMTEEEAEKKAQEKAFTESALTTAMLKAGIGFTPAERVTNDYQVKAHASWKRVTKKVAADGDNGQQTTDNGGDNGQQTTDNGTGNGGVTPPAFD